MKNIDSAFLDALLESAKASDRKRMNCDMRTTPEDSSQRMLNALLPGTEVPIHRHPMSNETVMCLRGKLVEILYEEVSPGTGFERGMDAQDVTNGRRLRETCRYVLEPAAGNYGCMVPPGVWHTVRVLEPSVILKPRMAGTGRMGVSNGGEPDKGSQITVA